MSETQLVLPTFDIHALDTALATLADDEREVEVLAKLAAKCEVKSADEFQAAGALLVKVRNQRKMAASRLAPFIGIVKQVLSILEGRVKAYERKVQAIDEDLAAKMNTYRERERAAAEREQQRIMEEKRREAERLAAEERRARLQEIEQRQRAGELRKREAETLKKQALAETIEVPVGKIEVQPAIPTVPGLRRRTIWGFRIADEQKIPRKYLRPNEAAIGAMVRQVKDKAKAEAECPGIVVFSEDAI